MGWEDPLKGTATHSSILVWRIPWTTHGVAKKESDMTEQLNKHICCILRKFLRAIFTFILFSIVAAVDLAAAAAKSLQSCPTLCDPIDGSPPGSPVPGIL